MMQLRFRSTLIEWRGPAPFIFAPLPPDGAEAIRTIAKYVSYGWGVIPVRATIGDADFSTSLFPRDGTYLLPIKAAARRKCNVTVGDVIDVTLTIGNDG